MILDLALLLLQEAPAAPAAEARQPERAEAWWQQLSPEERERLRQRWSQYRDLSPERREALRKRFETVEQERSMTWRRLGESERLQFEGWDERARRHWLDERVKERIRERGRELERREPELCDRLRRLPPEDRMRHSERFLREEHVDQARSELEKAVEEGWIGPAAAEWLRQAPPHELLTSVGQIHRWRFLQRAEREGFWEKHRVPPEERARMLELPTPFFFDEVRRLERGEAPPGPPGAPPPGAPRDGRRRPDR